ncbi:MBL fold metallo-hydrolase [Halobacteriales archaeon Cl-PHB]
MERISLSNSTFEGDNNVYLFADGAETVLVDTGDWTAASRDQLEAALADQGLAFGDVDRILLTHWHHDHTGLAGDIQAESGASVHVHAADAPLVAGDEDAWDAIHRRQETAFEAWGMPEAKREVLREWLTMPDLANTPEVTTFEDGETFIVNDHRLDVVHTSGHAAGLSMFELALGGESVVLSGDALLPVYTPNVGGADIRVDDALAKYVRALRQIAAADYDRAWPGHRDPIDDPADRAETIVDHHEERAWRVLDAVRAHQPVDTWTVSDALFGDLEDIHILHGPGEAHAHLEHLEAAGDVVKTAEGYRLADGVAEELEATDSQRWDLGL